MNPEKTPRVLEADERWASIRDEARELVLARRGAQVEIARELGLQTSSLHDYLSGRLEPRVSMGLAIMGAVVREKKRQAANASYAEKKAEEEARLAKIAARKKRKPAGS